MNTSNLAYDTDQLKQRGWDETGTLSFYQSDRTHFSGSVKIPLRSFNANAVMLVSDKPVETKLYFDNGSFFVESESLHIFANGQTVDEAMADFNDQIVHFYNYYTALEDDDVVGQAQQVRRIYSQHFNAIVHNAA